MKVVINNNEVEIYEFNGEKQVCTKDGKHMSLDLFEKLSNLNPKFCQLSDDEITELLMQIFPGGIWSK